MSDLRFLAFRFVASLSLSLSLSAGIVSFDELTTEADVAVLPPALWVCSGADMGMAVDDDDGFGFGGDLIREDGATSSSSVRSESSEPE